MTQYIMACDLGTGGNKASLYKTDGTCVCDCFVPYPTHYPQAGWHEQRPEDWWDCVGRSTRQLLTESDIDPSDVVCLGLSGHSLGAVPLDRHGRLLRKDTPIWSDSRAQAQARAFLDRAGESTWYGTTGNGFPAALYTVCKIMWYRDHEPAMFRNIHKVIGTKDYINFRLTGRMVTDYSYASGTGVYDLLAWDYGDTLLQAADLPREIFPDLVASTEVIGCLTPEAAAHLNLPGTVQVVAGGVDNSCMALGARAFKEGRAYNALGSSSWIAVSSHRPLLSDRARPYVFTHVVPDMFTSAVAIFSAGSSFRWVRDTLCRGLAAESRTRNASAYDLMTDLAATSPVGARNLLFNPSLAGGTSLDASPNIRGAFIGLDLGHTQADVIRAVMEGVAMGLRVSLDELRRLVQLGEDMVVVGGGSQSRVWRQIYADMYHMRILKTNIDQQAAALGAAAVAAVGAGLWPDFARIDQIHEIEDCTAPAAVNMAMYDRLFPVYCQAAANLAALGDRLTHIKSP